MPFDCQFERNWKAWFKINVTSVIMAVLVYKVFKTILAFIMIFIKKKKKNRTLTPNASPAMTLTSIPSLDETGMFSATISWIDGSCIFSFLARLIHSCRPWAFSSPCDHSQCMMPRPAVNHWKHACWKKLQEVKKNVLNCIYIYH